jgi:hypothetical protein
MSTLTGRERLHRAGQFDSPAGESIKSIYQSSVYIVVFSGKLSPVMTQSTLAQDEQAAAAATTATAAAQTTARAIAAGEVGGRHGPEPTRFGDWELRGRCIDF